MRRGGFLTGIERLGAVFDAAQQAGRKVLVPYITGGDPSLEVTDQLLDALAAGGADVIELGVPFSDPTADGRVIQLAAERALEAGTTVRDLLGVVRRFRRRYDTPVILFGYYNPFLRYGLEAFAKDAAAAGACGALCVDLPPEEAGPMLSALRSQGMCLVPLITPVSGDDRVARAAEYADSFAYYVSATGVTGLSLEGRQSIAERVAEVRQMLGSRLVVGFGVRTPEDAARMAEGADGVVVGTALVELAHRSEPAERASAVQAFIGGLRAAVAARAKLS